MLMKALNHPKDILKLLRTKIKGDKINIDDLPKNYKPYELVNITEISSDNIGEPKNEIKENNLKKLLKRLDIDEKNIITEKRTRK